MNTDSKAKNISFLGKKRLNKENNNTENDSKILIKK